MPALGDDHAVVIGKGVHGCRQGLQRSIFGGLIVVQDILLAGGDFGGGSAEDVIGREAVFRLDEGTQVLGEEGRVDLEVDLPVPVVQKGTRELDAHVKLHPFTHDERTQVKLVREVDGVEVVVLHIGFVA